MKSIVWVFPVAPIACDYAKLYEYFWQITGVGN